MEGRGAGSGLDRRDGPAVEIMLRELSDKFAERVRLTVGVV